MKTFSKALLTHVSDGDLHLRMKDIPYSTNLREIITVEYMMEHFEGGENNDVTWGSESLAYDRK